MASPIVRVSAIVCLCLASALIFVQARVHVRAQVRQAGEGEVTRATLDNGLRVVILRNPLAPVVTVEQNYLVGGNETPQGFPGMAHAQEHMAFRGCADLTGDQISLTLASTASGSTSPAMTRIALLGAYQVL